MAFRKLEGDVAVLQAKGVYQQVDLYTFQGGLFAKRGAGFVRLKADGSTSDAGVMLNHLETELDLWKGEFGRLCTEDKEGRTPVLISTGDKLQIEDKS